MKLYEISDAMQRLADTRFSKNRSMGISGGLNVRWDNFYDLDLGLLYDVLNIYINESTTKLNEPNFRFRIGAVLQNLGTKSKYPRMLKFGALAGANLRLRDIFPAEQNIPMNLSLLRVNVAGEVTTYVESIEESLEHFGMEMWMLDILAVRLGYKSEPPGWWDYYSAEGITFGFGLRMPLASIIAFAIPQSSEPNLIDKLYRQTDRQMFLQLDFARTPDEDLNTFALSGGF